MANLLEIKDAQRQIGDSFALCNVNLAVAPGEIVGFVGANGAGKTTTIRAALGLMKLDAGEVRLFGEPFGPNAPDSTQRHVRSRIGVVFDTCPYPAEFTIAQMERCLAPAFPTWDKAQFWRLAERFSLSRKAKVKDLSRGMGMKLQLAVALSHKADLLVLDEATAGLDPIARDDVLATLREFATQEGHGVLLSSHITSDLDRIADRVVATDDGRIISICLAKKLPTWQASPIALQNRLTRFSNASKGRALSGANSVATCSCPTASSSPKHFLKSPATTPQSKTTCTSH